VREQHLQPSALPPVHQHTRTPRSGHPVSIAHLPTSCLGGYVLFMDEVLGRILAWRQDGRAVTLARVVELRGISGQYGTPLAALTAGQPMVGTLLSGAADDLLAPVATATLHTVSIDDSTATASGMACGGSARVILQPAADLPDDTWRLLGEREPICLVTELDGTGVGATSVYTRATVAGAEQAHPGVARLFNRGTSEGAILDDGRAAVTAVWPVPTLVIVGDGLIADALAAAARVLGWNATVVNDAPSATAAIDGLARCDGVVVLNHHRDVDGPALRSALVSNAGYVGAMGARHTQQARAQWLAERGIDDLSRIHGPAGLDLNARTPGEIAIAIVAEMLAERSGRTAVSLRGRAGPIHEDGLSAPPPRYA
jgi:xanthine dehydrogenase accessory factor